MMSKGIAGIWHFSTALNSYYKKSVKVGEMGDKNCYLWTTPNLSNPFVPFPIQDQLQGFVVRSNQGWKKNLNLELIRRTNFFLSSFSRQEPSPAQSTWYLDWNAWTRVDPSSWTWHGISRVTRPAIRRPLRPWSPTRPSATLASRPSYTWLALDANRKRWQLTWTRPRTLA